MLCVRIIWISHQEKKNFRTDEAHAVFVQFSEQVSKPPDRILPVAGVLWPFDFETYFTATDALKKKQIVGESLHNALVWIANKMGWPVAPFDEVYKEARNQEFTLSGISKKAWTSPNKRFKVRIAFTFDVHGVDLWAVLFRNRSTQELARLPLGIGPPLPNCLIDYLDTGEWISQSEFELRSGSFIGEKWRANFSDVLS
jgi:hypothetical protein